MRLLSALLIAPVWLAAQSAPSAPADTADKKGVAPPAPTVNHLETTLAGFKLSGFAEASYAYSGRSLGDTAIVGRLYDRLQNRFTLNALAVVLDRPYDPAKLSAGFHTELLVGQDATVIQSNGLFAGAGTPVPVDVPHLYVTLHVPTASGHGLSRKLGKAAVWVQGDYGKEQANAALPDPTQDAQWWALGGWVTYDFSTSLGLALRGDYVNDQDGARTNGVFGFPANTGQKFGSGTATLNIRAWPDAVVRPELRYDRSTLAAFAGQKDQVTFALAVAYLY